jgi:hypothetical protein
MTAEVKPLFGGFTHQPEVVDSVVAALEEMLQSAKDGQLVGLAVAMVDCKGSGSYPIGRARWRLYRLGRSGNGEGQFDQLQFRLRR